jgi:hypothetical protein
MSFDADKAAASTFSPNIRRYSAGEHLSRAMSNVRRAIVSKDAVSASAIIIGNETVFRRLRFLATKRSYASKTRRRSQFLACPLIVVPSNSTLGRMPHDGFV